MTSLLRVRRRPRLPEANLGLSKNLPMTRNLALPISYCFAISVTASAQNAAPVVTTSIAPFTVYAGAPARAIDLTTAFADPDASNAVQLSVSLPSSTGTFTIALDVQHKPVTVGNFLNYVNSGRYFATDPTTQLVDSNDNWQSSPKSAQIQASGLAPPDSAEPAVLVTPPNGKLHCHCPGGWGNAYRTRPTRDLSAIGRLLFSGSLHNLGEAPGIEAGAADERPINIRLRH